VCNIHIHIIMSNKKRKTSKVEFEYTGIESPKDVPKDVIIVRFHSSVTEVGDCMFDECRQLKEVILNEGLRKIGRNAFYGCKQLEHINLPSTLIEMGDNAFCECDKLKSVRLNEGLNKIGKRLFCSCRSLSSITFPSTITEVGILSFLHCISLKKVVLNEGLQTIGLLAFERCSSLECVTIPSTVTEIVGGSFVACQRLREVGLHEGIQKIARVAFEGCTSLERFTFPSLSTRLETITRAGITEVEDKIDNVRGQIITRRDSDVFIPAVGLGIISRDANWKRVKRILGRIDRFISYYELKEATTLLELAMWKSKIGQADTDPMKRDEYRIDIPGPVKDTILQYLNFRVIGDNFLVG
jgi:hypothetical protein